MAANPLHGNSLLFSLAGHKGPKAVRRYMFEGQMNTIALCLSMFVEVNKGPNKNGLGPDLAHGPPFEKACNSLLLAPEVTKYHYHMRN